MEHIWRRFLYRTEPSCNCYTHHNLWQRNELQSLCIQNIIRVFLLQEVLFARAVHSVGVSEYGHSIPQAKKVCYTLEQQIRQFSFKEGRLYWKVACRLYICTDFVILHHFVSTLWRQKSSNLHKSKLWITRQLRMPLQ